MSLANCLNGGPILPKRPARCAPTGARSPVVHPRADVHDDLQARLLALSPQQRAEFERLLAARQRHDRSAGTDHPARGSTEAHCPLSSQQERIWLLVLVNWAATSSSSCDIDWTSPARSMPLA